MAQRNDERAVQDRPGTGRYVRWNNSIGRDCIGLGRYKLAGSRLIQMDVTAQYQTQALEMAAISLET